jgi:hypothetical protein
MPLDLQVAALFIGQFAIAGQNERAGSADSSTSVKVGAPWSSCVKQLLMTRSACGGRSFPDGNRGSRIAREKRMSGCSQENAVNVACASAIFAGHRQISPQQRRFGDGDVAPKR